MLSYGVVALVGGLSFYILSNLQHQERVEYKPYEYLGIRHKRFPWGDGNKSLFHNPKLNGIPGVGYEE